MKGSLRRALALLVAIMMVSTCMPLTALAEIIEASGSVQPFRVIQPDQGVYVTFEFYNGDEKVDTQIVTNGDTLYAPASPEKEGYKFTGWMKEGGEAFGGFGVVEGYAESQTIRLDAGFEQVYYVFFLDQNGTVCVTKEGLSGASISTTDVTFPTATDEGIAGWYYDADKKVPAGSAVTLEDANIILYPDVQQGHWLTFNTAGGSYLDPVFVAPGAVTQTPDTPTRLGFDFLGWYNGEQPFSFGQELTASVELTAKWQGHQVDYKVLYWLENADDDGYSLDKMDTLHGIAGEMTEAGSNYNPGEGFHLSADHSLVQQTIAGDGSTLVNVYYDRDVYTIYFYQRNASTTSMICGKEAHTHNRRCYDRWGNLTCGKEEHTHTAACYAPNPSAYAADPIVAKYGAYIGDQWPSNNESGNNWSTQSNGSDPYQANIQTMPLGGTTFYVPDNGGYRRFSATYYAEVLDGERGTVSYDGRMYNVHHTDVIYANSSSLYVSEEDRYPLVGFTFVDGTALNANYNRAVFYYTRNDYTLTRINQGTTDAHTVQYEADISGYGAVPERPAGIPENYAFQGWYLDEEFQEAYDFSGKVMPAQNVTVYAKWAAPEVDATVYLTMAGDGEPRVQAIPYGTKIDEEWLESLQVTAPEGYTWHGWATKNGDVYTPFNLDTIITQDVTLYPYYTSNASFTVAYDANGGEGTVADAKKYADRAYADVQSYAGLTAPQGKVFLGWNTAADGSGEMYQPGDKLLVAAENANEGNVVTLYAQWGGQAGTVELTYHANFTEAATATKEETQLINNGVITVSSYEATGLSERAGYEFTGWNTAADGTGTAFAAGQNVRVNDKSAAEANHLYAQWEKKVATYTVQHYIQVLDAEDKLQYELADEESFTVDVGMSVNDELINALKKSDLTDADDGIGSPAYADRLYHYVYERNEAELAVDGQITSDADVIKLYYQRELTRTVFDDGVVSAEDAYEDDPNEIRQGVITVETHYVGGSKDGTVNTNKVYFKFNKSEMVDLKIAVNSDEYILNTITADLSGGNGWDGTVLDNVLGNSTVRIYLTPKYTLEYYKVENGEETRVYADVETKTYTLAPETTGTQAFVQTEYPTSATLQPLPEEEGYTWSGWYQDAGLTGDTLPENSVQKINDLVEDTTEKVIKLYTGNKTANKYPYTIHHYLDGTWVKVAEDTTGTAAFGTDVTVKTATEFLAGYEDAQAKTIPGKITIKVDGNEATVYYTVPLTLTADGASKTYDGDPLTCGTFTADGLVNGDEVTDFALSMTAESTITNVGTQPNVIDEETVTYKGGAIPSYYTVTYEPGTLTIEKRNVTLTSATDEKEYDGTALTNDNVTVSGEGFADGEGAAYTVTGSQTLVGSSANTFTYELNEGTKADNYTITKVEGTLTVTDRTAKYEITVEANSDTVKYDGTEKSVSGLKQLTFEVEGQQYTVEGLSASASGTDAGEYVSEVTGDAVVKDTEGNDVTPQFTVNKKDGALTIEKRNVTLTSATDEKEYDGTALTNDNVTVSGEGFADGEGAAYTVTGSQTLVGSSANTFTYELNEGTKADNYTITKVEGTLTVTDRTAKYEITVEANSDTVKYDGTEKSVSGLKQLTFEVEGQQYTVEGLSASASGTDAGEYVSEVTGDAVVKDTEGNDVTPQFTVNKKDGALTIEKRNVTLTSATDEKEYDGTALTNDNVTVSGEGFADGEGAAYTVTGSQTLVGSSANTFTYELNEGTKADNYTITKVEGTLTVTDRTAKYEITVEANSDTVKYDGTEKNVSGLKQLTFEVEGQQYTVEGLSASASGTDAGEYVSEVTGDAVVKDTEGNDVTPQFTVNKKDGALTIEKRNVTLTSATDEKEYDGTALTNDNVTVSGEGFADGEGAAYTVTGSQTLVGSSANTFTYELNEGTKADNYTITKVEGTLTVTDRTAKYEITVEANSDTVKYDGTEKSVSGLKQLTFEVEGQQYTVEGLSASASGTDAGEYVSEVTGDAVVKDTEGNDVTPQFTVNKKDGALTIEKRNVTLTSATDEKEYDGTALTNDNVTVSGEGFADGEGAAYTVTGSQTLVGSSANTFTYELNEGTKADNYTITKVEGTLTVTDRTAKYEITVEANSDTVKYDGTEKSVSGLKQLTFEVEGQQYTVEGLSASASGTDAGEYVSEVTGDAVVKDAEGNDVTPQFTVNKKDGALTIEQRPVTVTVNTETYKYDGYLKTVADDNGQEYTVEGESEGRGLLNGDDISLNVVYGVYADEAQSLVGQYTADAKDGSIVISNANGDVTKNYAVTVVPGWLVITDGTEDDPVNPDAVLTKTHLAGVYDLGDVTFTITVKNIYNEAKTITIREQPGVELIGADEEGKIVYQDVPAGEQVTAYAKYTITEADILEGTFTNHVTAEFSDAKTYTNEDTVDIADLDTTLTVVKSSGVPEGGTASLGETINYTITVTNDGNVSYTGVKVVDDLAGLKINEDTRYTVNEDGTVTVGDLAVGETVVITASYVVTSDDIKAGHVLNTVTATGDSIDDPKNPDKPKKPEGKDEEDDETDDLDTTLTVTKSSDVAEGATVGLGETINYTITVKNDGNVPYTGVKVVDDLAGLQIHEDARYTVEEDGTVTVGDLAVGETVTITASYIVTSDDIKAGHVLNAVTAAGDPIEDPKNPDEPKKPEGEDEEDNETDDLDTTLTVTKSSDVAEGATVGLGETINYTITVKNDGNVPYTGVKVVDDLAGLQIHEDARYTVEEDGTVTVGDLAVGETVTITASYIVTSDDIKAGHVLNAVTAAGDPIEDPKNPDEPKKPEGEDEEDDETDDLDTTLTVVKTSDVAEGATVGLGDTIIYTFTVTNDGNVPYTGVSVVDALDGLKFTSSSRYWVIEDNTAYITKLAVGETVWLEASYVVTSDDIKAGHVLNMVTATADPIEDPNDPENPKKPEGKDEEDDETDDLDTMLTVTKSSDVAEGATVGLGETINYTITVKNDGNVPYTGVKVVDDLAGPEVHIEFALLGDRR